MLPDFVIIGAAKAATTSLARYLGAHPEIFMAESKEVNYFSFHHDAGPDWYESHFEAAAPGQRIGEASPQYTRHPAIPHCAERMAETIPKAQLIYSVREPIGRIRSHYRMRVERGQEDRTFDRAVRDDPMYLDATRYAFQLGRYLDRYDRDRVLVVSSERLLTDRASELRRVLEFLEVDPSHEPDDLDEEFHSGHARTAPLAPYRWLRSVVRRTPLPRLMSSRAKQEINQRVSRPFRPDELDLALETQAWIWSELDDDLRRLRSLVGPDFDLWGRA
jgi:Sulfotransferase family